MKSRNVGCATAEARQWRLPWPRPPFTLKSGEEFGRRRAPFDYLDALDTGRIDGLAESAVHRPAPAAFVSDARGSIAQLAFDNVVGELVDTARALGICIFSLKNSYTCGELGYFFERLAREGLVSIAGTNTSALMSAGGATSPVLGTNPMAFATPRQGKPPLVVDQASSQTAFVNIREAARTGSSIPPGWAIDHSGNPSTDAEAALQGALLPFGGYKGGNIALIIEIPSALSGANWSLDAWPFDTGTGSPF